VSRSRKRTGKQPNKPQLQVAQTQRRQPNILPGATNFTPLNDKVMGQMYQQMAPQTNGTPFYAPGAPIRPIPGITPPQGPRQFSVPVGYNISQLPRGTEEYSFDDLRSLASTYDGIQLCEQVWFDYISKLELVIEPLPELIDDEQDISMYQPDIDQYMEFFESPDKEHDLHTWLQMAVRDQLELDALAIYPRKNKIGGLYSLDILDGSTVKPLSDDRGRRPLPPFPAYEQFVYGVPSALLTSDDLIYVKETERTDSFYGRSRVERIILKVNQALRKQSKDLMRFTDGSIPAGVIEPSIDLQWTQEQIEAYETQFNNLLGGNDQLRARIKVLPRGMTYKPTDDPDVHIDLDLFLLNITAACHGLTMDELAITASSNRSVGQTQENVIYRRAMSPLMNRYAKLLTHILRKYFNEKRFVIKWRGFEEVEDFNAQATGMVTLTNAGIISPSRAAHLMHLPVDVELDSPILMTKSGPILLSDFADPQLRQAQKDAQIAGLQLATQNPGAKPSDPTQPGQDDDDEEEDDIEDGSQKKTSESKPSANDDRMSLPDDDRAINLEYRRWRDVAINDVKAGRSVRRFASTLIPSTTLAMGYLALQRCSTPEDVKQFFNAMREAVYA
jgi:Phage portal protein